jgi:outer membrane protein OmpA-like peptidoglycan-associated protein
MIRSAVVLWFLLATSSAALELTLPATAQQTVERNTSLDRYEVPVGVFASNRVPKLHIDGEVRRTAWRLALPGLTPLQVMRPLRKQIEAAGYEVVLDCEAEECGGFDFRFAIETLPGPNMYVSLRAFHVVTGLRLDAQDRPIAAVSLLTSTSSSSAYVQMIEAIASDIKPAAVASKPRGQAGEVARPPGNSGSALLRDGHLVLRDLDFDTGTSSLGPGPFGSLEALADLLIARPGLRIALVGHTDTIGGLEPNIALSRRRAVSVRQRLIERYGAPSGQIDAEGMGYLAPVASNLTEAGRDANRRVEAVVLSLD